MNNFCTLFDSNYLSRGLVMYESLKINCEDFHLYILAFDDIVYNILKSLNLEYVTVISLNHFEDERLLSIKNKRLKREYCWTCTSSLIFYIFNNCKIDICTYLDADLYFYASPVILLDELKDSSVIITKHRYTPEYDHSKIYGIYCVQFITFKNDKRGNKVLKWWKDECLCWCYSRLEDGKFGDQKYLDNWTTDFEGVHELEHLGGGVAPWNVQQYNIFKKDGKLICREIKTDKEFDLIFYHFHNLRFYKNDKVDLSAYKLSEDVIKEIYKPYLIHLAVIKNKISNIDNNINSHDITKQKFSWRIPASILLRKLKKIYNVFSIEDLIEG